MTTPTIPLLYIDIKETTGKWPKKRAQKFYFVVLSAGNFKALAKSETYTNRSDCVAAARLVGSEQTSVFLRQVEQGDEVLRYSTLIEKNETS